jgi:glycosyltransferase involved in cell wall biosynthesis
MLMKIAICLPSLPVSGIGTSVGIIHDGLKVAGCRVDVLITGNDAGRDQTYADASGWHVIKVAEGERFLPKRLKATLTALHDGAYDVVLNNTSMETQLILPCLSERMRRVSVMRGLNPRALRMVALNSTHADAIIGISREMVRVLKADRRVRAPVRLIPNCTRVVGGEFPRLSGRLEVCYVGRLAVQDKNALLLPEIAHALKGQGAEFRLRIAGEGPAGDKLRGRLGKLQLREVELCGMLSREACRDLLSHSHFALLPSISEGLSNVLLECMALGCLPVCSDIENFKWVLGEAAPQLQCRLHDPQDYAARLLYFNGHENEYRRLQAYLRSRQQELFTPEQTVRGYLDLLAELASTRERALPHACALNRLRLPLKCWIWSSPVWRGLQTAKRLFFRSPRHGIPIS